jgi:hypothetical protein
MGLTGHHSGTGREVNTPSGQGKGQVKRGGPRGDRTLNPRIKSPLLCQLS